jgi:hypothetical protein
MEVQEGFCFVLQEFCISGDKMSYNVYEINADGAEYELYKEDSEEAKVQTVLKAYVSYIDNLYDFNERAYAKYAVAYIDNDDIPELVMFLEDGCLLFSYVDTGVVCEVLNNVVPGILMYGEKSGYYVYRGGDEEPVAWSRLENGVSERVAYAKEEEDEDDVLGEFETHYYIEQGEVSEEDYKTYLSEKLGECDEYSCSSGDAYATVYEAYNNTNMLMNEIYFTF